MRTSRTDTFNGTRRFRRWLRGELRRALDLVEAARPDRKNPALHELGEVILTLDLRLMPLLVDPEEVRREHEERKRQRRIAIREAGLEEAIMRLNAVVGNTAGSLAETRIPPLQRLWIDTLLSRLLDLLSHANPASFSDDWSRDPDDVYGDERILPLIAALRQVFPNAASHECTM